MSNNPNESIPELNFSAILGSSVHDMKNSLSIIRDLIGHMAKDFQHSEYKNFGQLEFEANRMNNSLMQLLVLYKLDLSRFNLTIDEYPAIDLLNEVVAQQEALLALNDIQITIECEEDLYCYCDFNIISSALSTILNNSQRYTKQQILLSAKQEKQHIIFCIEDDGAGYPDIFMQPTGSAKDQVNFNTGSTGLGLFFAQTMAAMHSNGGNVGSTIIDNQSKLGGARFKLLLP